MFDWMILYVDIYSYDSSIHFVSVSFLSYFHHISGMSVLSLSVIKSRHLGFTSCAAGIYAKLCINV